MISVSDIEFLVYLHAPCEDDNVAESSLMRSRVFEMFKDKSTVNVEQDMFEIQHEFISKWMSTNRRPRYVGEDGIKWYLLAVKQKSHKSQVIVC